MEEQFILRVPPSVAERIEQLLSENATSSELDLSFPDGRSGTFAIGDQQFPASLLDLPTVVESYKTYDDSALVKTADIGQMIMVREAGDTAPDTVEYRHGITPPMRDARKRRFRREPDLNPELVQRVERDLMNILTGGPVEHTGVDSRNASKEIAPVPAAEPAAPEVEGAKSGEADRSDSDESDDSM
jgi:transcription initiation factor TFIID subunit 7